MPLISEQELSESIGTLFERRVRPPGGYPDRARPVPPGGRLSLDEVLAGRRSVRVFHDRSPDVDQLATVVGLAEAADARTWPAGRHGGAAPHALIAAFRVRGLERGLYVPAREGPGFDRIGAPAWQRELAGEYADAPAIALICGPVHRAGDGAYGGVLVRAGAFGYALWLAARSHGLDCSVYGATMPAVSRQAERTAPGTAHLFTVALGYAPDAG